MHKHTPKIDLSISGRMSQKDCGLIGKVLALAVLLAAFAPVIYASGHALANVIHAVRWW